MLAELSPWNVSAIVLPMFNEETKVAAKDPCPTLSLICGVLDSLTVVLNEILVFFLIYTAFYMALHLFLLFYFI